MTRTVSEQVIIGNGFLNIQVATSDGLNFEHKVELTDTDANGFSSVKHFEDQLAIARKGAYDRRVWLNKRKSLTLNEINQLLANENTMQVIQEELKQDVVVEPTAAVQFYS